MGDAGYFKGASADQDSRFSNKEKKLLKSTNFPTEFDQKVNIKKINLDVIKPWIANRITQLLGVDDELIVDFAFGLLEEEKPDPKRMQINLTGFLENNAPIFMLELWKLLLSAQDSVGGIPKEFIEQKKEELRLKKEQEEKRRAEEEATLDTIRQKKAQEQENYPRRERRSRFDTPSSRRHRSRESSPYRHHRRSRSPSPYHQRRYHYHRSRSPPSSSREQDRYRYERRHDSRERRYRYDEEYSRSYRS
ncbi:serine/arginine repetitive matrix 1 [Halteromyces radiatus]|uniref:serine/arginine repetitive matrix 1 n=1 Tax=Halteromyces radiatus TaxID=101107 RepID=UPI0022206A71|nr:serine/arginine repetitive matrix 1 [Halteromyces radiatus]KAI8096398.1 serine/arginine repetitive matrix 1 [Halteromyces radiatus]